MRTLSRHALAALLVCTLAACALPSRAEEMGVTCGPPAKGGWINLWIKISRPTGLTETINIELQITGPPVWTAELKAEFFRISLPDEFANKVVLSGEGRDVKATGLNGWRVSGMGIDNDETNEPDTILSAVTPTDELALCSLSGVASGQTAIGTPGSFALQIAGHSALVPTAPGLPAQLIEQQVMSQLQAQGVPAHFATPQEIALLAGVPQDGVLLAIPGPDAAGLAQDLRDSGLVLDLAGLVSPPLPEPDPAATIAGTDPDGSFLSFGSGSLQPIPGDFFYPGSEPFWGTVCLAGAPFLDADDLGDASTIIQRHGTGLQLSDPPGSVAEIPIEIIALHLVSCQPITVTDPGGQTQLWDVRVGLSPLRPSLGSLTQTKSHANGGTFSSSFQVQPRFTFTRLSDQHTLTLEDGLPPLDFVAADGHWVHAVDPALGVITFGDGSFVPGVEELVPGDPLSQVSRRTHALETSGAARHTLFPARALPTAAPAATPAGLALRCYPNPGRPGTRIGYVMPAAGALQVAVYDLSGRRLRRLADGTAAAGAGGVAWDGRDDKGDHLPAGVYLCRIAALGQVATAKLVLLE